MAISRYTMKSNTHIMLQSKGLAHCVSCGHDIELGQEVTSKRSGNNLRIRCIECSERYGLI